MSHYFPSSLIRYVNLSDIQLDIMDYIRPAECKAEDFRGMWAEFEWENKVSVDSYFSTHAQLLFPLNLY
jgi:coatomer subunit beta